MQILAVIADIAITKRILDHLNLDSTGPPISARGFTACRHLAEVVVSR